MTYKIDSDKNRRCNEELRRPRLIGKRKPDAPPQFHAR